MTKTVHAWTSPKDALPPKDDLGNAPWVQVYVDGMQTTVGKYLSQKTWMVLWQGGAEDFLDEDEIAAWKPIDLAPGVVVR